MNMMMWGLVNFAPKWLVEMSLRGMLFTFEYIYVSVLSYFHLSK